MGFQYSGKGIVSINSRDIGNVLSFSIVPRYESKKTKHRLGGTSRSLSRLASLEAVLRIGELSKENVALALGGSIDIDGNIILFDSSIVESSITFTGENEANGVPVYISLPKVLITDISNIDIITDEFSEFEITCEVLRDTSNVATPFGIFNL